MTLTSIANKTDKNSKLLTFPFLLPLTSDPRIDLVSENVVFTDIVIWLKGLLCLDLLVLESWGVVLDVVAFL